MIQQRLNQLLNSSSSASMKLTNCVVDIVIGKQRQYYHGSGSLQDRFIDPNTILNQFMADEYCVYIIELNPLAEFAGSGLFSWENPNDKALLLGFNGSNTGTVSASASPSPVVRYHRSAPSKYPILGSLAPEYRKWMSKYK